MARLALNCLACLLHNYRVNSVARHCKYTCLITGLDKDIVILRIRHSLTVVQLNCADRTCKYGQSHLMTEEIKRRIRCLVLDKRIHVESYTLPCIIISYGSIADSLSSRSRNQISAGPSVADRTGLAIRSYVFSCIRKHLLISHNYPHFLRQPCHCYLAS